MSTIDIGPIGSQSSVPRSNIRRPKPSSYQSPSTTRIAHPHPNWSGRVKVSAATVLSPGMDIVPPPPSLDDEMTMTKFGLPILANFHHFSVIFGPPPHTSSRSAH